MRWEVTTRSDMFGRRRLTESDMAAAVKAAVADATAMTVLQAHIAKCDEDKRLMREAIQNQSVDRERMHAENAAKFDRLNRLVLMAAGAVSFVVFALSTQFGSSILGKLVH